MFSSIRPVLFRQPVTGTPITIATTYQGDLDHYWALWREVYNELGIRPEPPLIYPGNYEIVGAMVFADPVKAVGGIIGADIPVEIPILTTTQAVDRAAMRTEMKGQTRRALAIITEHTESDDGSDSPIDGSVSPIDTSELEMTEIALRSHSNIATAVLGFTDDDVTRALTLTDRPWFRRRTLRPVTSFLPADTPGLRPRWRDNTMQTKRLLLAAILATLAGTTAATVASLPPVHTAPITGPMPPPPVVQPPVVPTPPAPLPPTPVPPVVPPVPVPLKPAYDLFPDFLRDFLTYAVGRDFGVVSRYSGGRSPYPTIGDALSNVSWGLVTSTSQPVVESMLEQSTFLLESPYTMRRIAQYVNNDRGLYQHDFAGRYNFADGDPSTLPLYNQSMLPTLNNTLTLENTPPSVTTLGQDLMASFYTTETAVTAFVVDTVGNLWQLMGHVSGSLMALTFLPKGENGIYTLACLAAGMSVAALNWETIMLVAPTYEQAGVVVVHGARVAQVAAEGVWIAISTVTPHVVAWIETHNRISVAAVATGTALFYKKEIKEATTTALSEVTGGLGGGFAIVGLVAMAPLLQVLFAEVGKKKRKRIKIK